ncbi:MAG: hypothetical protein ABI684_08875, partial [Nitrospirota bacterium]
QHGDDLLLRMPCSSHGPPLSTHRSTVELPHQWCSCRGEGHDMGLCRVLGVLDSINSVSLRNLGMVTGFVVLGRFLMVTSSLLVMLSGFLVVWSAVCFDMAPPWMNRNWYLTRFTGQVCHERRPMNRSKVLSHEEDTMERDRRPGSEAP